MESYSFMSEFVVAKFLLFLLYLIYLENQAAVWPVIVSKVMNFFSFFDL